MALIMHDLNLCQSLNAQTLLIMHEFTKLKLWYTEILRVNVKYLDYTVINLVYVRRNQNLVSKGMRRAVT